MKNSVTYPSPDMAKFMENLRIQITRICDHDIVGIYLHGSLAMGCFNPERSDVDLIVVTNEPPTVENKKKLAQYLLGISNDPYPIEISFLNKEQLQRWQHPFPYDFHYSEDWRRRYEGDLQSNNSILINDSINHDPDLAAHITIINHRGICMVGKPISEVFPLIPKEDYIDSIMGDFKDCLEDIIDNPIYCSLNLLRVLRYRKDGVISSKLEAGIWGLESLPGEWRGTIQKAIDVYTGKIEISNFSDKELLDYREFIANEVENLIAT